MACLHGPGGRCRPVVNPGFLSDSSPLILEEQWAVEPSSPRLGQRAGGSSTISGSQERGRERPVPPPVDAAPEEAQAGKLGGTTLRARRGNPATSTPRPCGQRTENAPRSANRPQTGEATGYEVDTLR